MTTNTQKESTAYYLGYNNQTVSLGYLLESIVCHESNIESDRQSISFLNNCAGDMDITDLESDIKSTQKDIETLKATIGFLFPDYNQN